MQERRAEFARVKFKNIDEFVIFANIREIMRLYEKTGSDFGIKIINIFFTSSLFIECECDKSLESAQRRRLTASKLA